MRLPITPTAVSAACLALSALVGALVFATVVGGGVLDPRRVAWLMSSDDTAMPYLGWVFFRDVPAALPPGLNPGYGMELGSSIYFSDSLPLLALPLKVLSPWLPTPFQYHGAWLLACFMLQGVFGWQLARALRMEWLAALVMAAFACFVPAFLARAGGQPEATDHLSLAAHWLLLAALWLNAREAKGPTAWWPLLLAVAALVHAYLLAMVLALWIPARWGAASEATPAARRGYVRERLAAYGAMAVTLWAAGFFEVSALHGLRVEGFGRYRMNLAAPFDSNGWSAWWQDLPGNIGDHEGFAYLGLGQMLLLVLAALVLLFRQDLRGAIRTQAKLATILSLLALFAVSHRVGLGASDLFTVPIPHWLENLATTFRASGRFVWPALYALLFGAAWVLARALGRPVAIGVLALALAIQVAETSPGWRAIGPRWAAANRTGWATTLASPEWAVLAQRYSAIWSIPPQNWSPRWRDIAWLAGSFHRATNAVYITRFDLRRLRSAERHAADVLAGRSVDGSRLYLLDPASAAILSSHLQGGDLLLQLDGFHVLAPGAADLRERLSPGIDRKQ